MFLFTYAARSRADQTIPEYYRYLARINVRPAVIKCVAEIDRWIRTSAQYDMFIAPDGRLLKARARVFRAIEGPTARGPSVDSMVTIRASARLRPSGAWIPVSAKCSALRSHIVAITIKPSGTQ
ncbi:BspC domain-containing protein [Burkholderia cenocepacia]